MIRGLTLAALLSLMTGCEVPVDAGNSHPDAAGGGSGGGFGGGSGGGGGQMPSSADAGVLVLGFGNENAEPFVNAEARVTGRYVGTVEHQNGPSCTRVQANTYCHRVDCTDGGTGAFSQFPAPNAGPLYLDGGVEAFSFSWRAVGGGYYEMTGQGSNFGRRVPAGTSVVATAQGGTDIAAFTLTAAMPELPKLATPSLANGKVQLSSTAANTLTLQAPVSGAIAFDAEFIKNTGQFGGVYAVYTSCRYPAGMTTLDVPASLFSGLTGQVGGTGGSFATVTLDARNSTNTQRGAYRVELNVYSQMQFTDGGLVTGIEIL